MNDLIRIMSRCWNQFSKKYTKKENVIEIIKILSLLSIFALLSAFVIKFLYRQIVYFYNAHPLLSICIGFGILCLIGKMCEKEPEKESMPPRLSHSSRQQAYLHLRNLVYRTLIELSDVLDVYTPKSLNSLEPPEKISEKNKILYFHFIAVIKSVDINVDEAHQLLEGRINSLARSRKVAGLDIGNDVIINGACYPPIKVHDCHISGRYMEITLVLTSIVYLSQLDDELRIDLANRIDNDKDVLDDDF